MPKQSLFLNTLLQVVTTLFMVTLLGVVITACDGDNDSETAQTPQDAVDQITAEVEVLIDDLGVPHIYAANEMDAYFIQGYMTSHDRLFQMDVRRREAGGTLAEAFGQSRLDADRNARRDNFDEIAAETAAYYRQTRPELADLSDAYALGVTAYINDAVAQRNGASLSSYFDFYDYTPEPWRAEDTFMIEKEFTRRLGMPANTEATLGLFRMFVDDAVFTDFLRYEPMDASTLLNFFDTAQAPSAPKAPTTTASSPHIDVMRNLPVEDQVKLLEAFLEHNQDSWGSNNWVVSGNKSSSGHALLANDTHMGLPHPCEWYLVHINTAHKGGTLDSVGVSYPGVPLVLLGHNGNISWGATVNAYDSADAYFERQNSDATAVEFNGEMVPYGVRTEEIRVRNNNAPYGDYELVEHEVKYVPHHGPMLDISVGGLPSPPISFRWTGLEARSNAASYYALNHAKDVFEARDAIDELLCGGMNWVFADTKGNIGYSSRVDLPVREAIDRVMSPAGLVDGRGGFGWLPNVDPEFDRSYQAITRDLIPWSINPPEGFLSTANNDVGGVTNDNDPFNEPAFIGGLFAHGNRDIRIQQLLAEKSTLSFEDMQRIQNDNFSRMAELMLPFLFEAASNRPDLVNTPELTQAMNLLRSWDFRTTTDSVASSIFHGWAPVMTYEMIRDENPLLGGLVGNLGWGEGGFMFKAAHHYLELTKDTIDEIEAGTMPFPNNSGINPFDDKTTPELETRDEMLIRTLEIALGQLADVFEARGGDPNDIMTWEWGKWHFIQLNDFSGNQVPGAAEPQRPTPGGLYTVNCQNYNMLKNGQLRAEAEVSNAASVRFVAEMAPGAVRYEAILAGGQSERPGDANYKDQIDDYIVGGMNRIAFYRDEVEQRAVRRMVFPVGFPNTAMEVVSEEL